MLELYFFNVGHGDSIAIKFPNNEWGVIDCTLCDGQREPNVLKFLIRNNVERLKFVCVTHPHIDHFLGMERIVENYRNNIDDFILFDNGQNSVYERQNSSLRRALQAFVNFSRHKIILASTRQKYKVGDLEINLLNPNSQISEELFGKYFTGRQKYVLNKLSVVMYFEYQGCHVLLNADVPQKECTDFLKNILVKADIIKISHHGSIHNNSETLITSMGKQGCISIISSDGNQKYSSVPHENVLKCLEQQLHSNILKTFDLSNVQPPDSGLESIDAIDSISEVIDNPVNDGYFKIVIDNNGQTTTQAFTRI